MAAPSNAAQLALEVVAAGAAAVAWPGRPGRAAG